MSSSESSFLATLPSVVQKRQTGVRGEELFSIDFFFKKYLQENSASGVYHDADVVLVLAYSLIMLNTDAHNPKVR
tara:strand:- start:552 stop:776 length:225 start_codon:yes stop_codon:yes gene_type:complete